MHEEKEQLQYRHPALNNFSSCLDPDCSGSCSRPGSPEDESYCTDTVTAKLKRSHASLSPSYGRQENMRQDGKHALFTGNCMTTWTHPFSGVPLGSRPRLELKIYSGQRWSGKILALKRLSIKLPEGVHACISSSAWYFYMCTCAPYKTRCTA